MFPDTYFHDDYFGGNFWPVFNAAAVVAVEGLQWTVPECRFEYTVPANLNEYAAPTARFQFTVPNRIV
jgi:hypothetical protein